MPLVRQCGADLLDFVGSTPMVRLSRLPQLTGLEASIHAKLENLNPGGSVKDRICLSMIEAAEAEGRLQPGGTIIEPTTGNTGLGLAMIAAVKGYHVVLTMPETMSEERRALLVGYGARLEITADSRGMHAAIARAEDLLVENPDWYMPQQFTNPANPDAHRRTTGPEILRQVPDPQAFVAGVGTGGTITGVGAVLREARRAVEIVAVEPAASPVLSGGEPGFHQIQGIGAGFVPAVLDRSIYDRVEQVTDEEAAIATRDIARYEGLLVGISSGANLVAAVRTAKRLGAGARIVTVFCDAGQRYLTTDLFHAEGI
jgi:cysteine synthase A